MATVEVLPDLVVTESGSRDLGGGAGSTLAALNDSSDATWIEAAGTLSTNWKAYLRFANPSIPAGAAVTHVQVRMRYSHFVRVLNLGNYETFQPVSILVGRLSGGKHVYDAYTPGERFLGYSTLTSVQSATFPLRNKDWSGKVFIGKQYQLNPGRDLYASFQVTRHNVFNQARLYSVSLVVTYDEKPTSTLVNPAGTEVVARPPFDWTFTDPEGKAQSVYDVRIYTQALATTPGFSLDDVVRWPPEYRQVRASPVNHHDLERGFGVNGGSYRAYVRVRTANNWDNLVHTLAGVVLAPHSDWDSNDFTLSIPVPRAPLVTATYDSVKHGILVEVEGQDNLLSWNSSSVEVDTSQFFGGANTTIARVTSQFLHGGASLQLTRTTSTGDATVATPATSGDDTVPAEEGELYTARASFRANTTGRVCRVTLEFRDEDGTFIAATNTQHDVTDVSTGWVEVFTTAVAPVGAERVRVIATIVGAAASEIHFVDQLAVFPGRRTNLLTENQASLETDTTGYVAGTNTIIARDTTQFYRGLASLRLTRTTSTGDASASTPATTRANVGQVYIAAARFRAATTTRTCRVQLLFFNSTPTLIGAGTDTTVVDSTTGWSLASSTGTAPAGTAFVAVNLVAEAAVNGEIHYVDWVGIWPGSTVGEIHNWSVGGFLHDDPTEHVIELQRSIELDEHGFMIWETIPEPRVEHVPQHQMLTYADYEVPANVVASYRAKIEALNQDGDMMNSDWSNIETETMAVFTSWYLRDPIDPGNRTMKIRVHHVRLVTPKPNTLDHPVGAESAVMTHDGVKLDDVECSVDLLTEDDYHMFREMVDSGATLLLQDVHGRQWYIQPDDQTEYEILRAAKLPSEPWPIRHAHRVRITFRSVEKPRALGVISGSHAHA